MEKKDSILSDFVRKSIQDIEKRRANLYQMLAEYENELMLEGEPRLKIKYQKEIDSLKEQIQKSENELIRLKNL